MHNLHSNLVFHLSSLLDLSLTSFSFSCHLERRTPLRIVAQLRPHQPFIFTLLSELNVSLHYTWVCTTRKDLIMQSTLHPAPHQSRQCFQPLTAQCCYCGGSYKVQGLKKHEKSCQNHNPLEWEHYTREFEEEVQWGEYFSVFINLV